MQTKIKGPDKWGPWAWHLLHSVSIGDLSEINEKDKYYYYLFYKIIGKILPCIICKYHYNELFKENMLITDEITRKSIIKWTWELHNNINNMLNKNINISLDKCIKLNKKVRNNENFIFLNAMFNSFSNDITFNELLDYLTLLKSLSIIYPDKKVRCKLENNIKDLDNIGSAEELKTWYLNNKKNWQS